MLHRKIRDNFLWEEQREFSKFEAWIDLLMYARWKHEPKKHFIGNTTYIINRGEQIRSLKTLSSAWNWNISKVRRFLSALQNRHMVVIKTDTQTTQITICNYDTYQTVRHTDEMQMTHERNANEKQMNTIEERKEREEENKGNKYTPDFESAWNLYGRRGGKKQAYIEWKKLNAGEKEKVMKHIPRFIMGKEAKYIRHFERYLKYGDYESALGEELTTTQELVGSLYE